MNFYDTVGGRRFIEHTVPKLIKSIEILSTELHNMNCAAEAKKKVEVKNSPELNLDFIIQFAREAEDGEWDNETYRNQLKALWTAYCILYRLDADTYRYDKDIDLIWDAVISTMNIEGSDHIFADKGCFEDFMTGDLV